MRHIHIGVGFCVARSTMVGNAKASVRGTGNRYRLPRFFRGIAQTNSKESIINHLHMKHNLIIMVMLFTSLPTFSQYVELPVRDLYDTETMISSINAARAAADVDNELARTLTPVI